MTARLIAVQAVDYNSNVLSGARLDVYDAGTSTRRAIYKTRDLASGASETNPAIADSAGVIAVWVDDATEFKVALTNADQSVTYFNQDNIDLSNGAALVIRTGIGADQGTNTTDSVTFGGLILNGNADLQGNRLILDADNDSYIETTADDNVRMVIAGQEVQRWDGDTDITELNGITLSLDGASTGDVLGFPNSANTLEPTTVSSIGGKTFDFAGAAVGQALGFPNNVNTVQVYTPAGGGDMLASANLTDVADLDTARENVGNPRRIVTSSEQAQAAFERSTLTPVFYLGESNIVVTPDYAGAADAAARFELFKKAVFWRRASQRFGAGDIIIRCPEGLIDLGDSEFEIDGSGDPVTLDCASQTFIDIASISLTNISGDEYEVTITLDEALPSYVVVDYPIGIHPVRGNNSAKDFGGAAQVRTIASDRLSFTYRRDFHGTPTAPSSLDANEVGGNPVTDIGFVINQVAVPSGAYGFSGGSTALEGLLTLRNGAKVRMRNIGWTYTGDASDGTFFYVDSFAHIDFASRVIGVGGPERFVRNFGGFVEAGRLMMGPSNNSDLEALVEAQAGGMVKMTQFLASGTPGSQILIGQSVQYYLAQFNVSGGANGLRFISAVPGMAYPGHIGASGNGISADSTKVTINPDAVSIERCGVGVTGVRGGAVFGSALFSGNTTDSKAPADTTVDNFTYSESSLVTPAIDGQSFLEADDDARLGSLLIGPSSGSAPGGVQVAITASTPIMRMTDSDTSDYVQYNASSGSFIVQMSNTSRLYRMLFGSTEVFRNSLTQNISYVNFNIASGGLLIGGTEAVDSDRIFKSRSYNIADLPSASSKGAGAIVYVADDVGGAIPAFSDGSDWRRMSDRSVVSAT